MNTDARVRILCVDDEPEVLRGLQLVLHAEYEVVTAVGGRAALELLRGEGEFAVIISDMRMPEMSGAELLAQSLSIAPATQRILLTGQTDLSSAIAAVNDGQIFRFLTKPCPPPELRRAVAAAVDRFRSQELERTAMRRKLEHDQLMIDPLTNLASRRHLMAILESAAYDASDAGFDTVAYFINIDASDEPSIPRELPWGDELATITADRLREYFGSARAIGRWGSEQFVVIELSADLSESDLDVRGEKLLEALTRPVQIDQDHVAVGARVGMARLTDRLHWQSLIQQAAGAAREVRGMAGVCRHQNDVPSQSARQRQLLRALRQAHENVEFKLHYQPIVNINTDSVHSLESLIRWEHKVLGSVSPATFIPVAEQSGDIVGIGKWVLWRACHEFQPFLKEGNLRLAVNVSARQVMEKDFLPDLEKCLLQYAIPADTLEMELTETALVGDIGELRAVLEGVRNLKVRISVDDFGTGYSSLSYLSRLPIDTIKVDRTFVSDFLLGGKTIIRAALAIANEFGKDVIIEGVETEAMLEQVRGLGATLVQGYLFATPMPMPQLSEWLPAFGAPSRPVRSVLAR
jgi:predicted signal transduction protein with EAL and GGDEF domain